MDSAAKEVWMTTDPGEHTAVLTEPTLYVQDLREGDKLVDVEMTGFRGYYLACRGPSTMELVEEVPVSPVSDKRSNDQGQPSSSFTTALPSLGILRDTHWRRTRYRAPCTHYTRGKCNLEGICASLKHPEGSAPPGWTFAELDSCGDVRGIPTKGRTMCTYWRDGHCKFEFSCGDAHFKRAWEPEEFSGSRSFPSGNNTAYQHASNSAGPSSSFPPISSTGQSSPGQSTQTQVKNKSSCHQVKGLRL